MRLADLKLDRTRLAALCQQYGVERLEAFGSFARGAARPESDLDLLVTYTPHGGDALDFVVLQQELEALVGRHVDLLSRVAVESSPNRYFRRFALSRTESLYERA